MTTLIEEWYYGILLANPAWMNIVGIIIIVLILGYRGAPLWLWTLAAIIAFWGFAAPVWLWIVAGIILLVLNIKPLRRMLITTPLMKLANAIGFLPTISPTQRVALEAGTTWIEGEFFTGNPNFNKIRKEKYATLSDKEKDFLKNQVEEVCNMQSDWEIFHEKDLYPEVWDYLKKERFFGMVIPEKYGGRGFSAYGMNAVIAKLGSRSVPLSVDVMVPNSLGPAELLLNYGTEKQKDYYLPRLAKGEEIPCFALTEPEAGSDASGIDSEGEVFKGEDGELYIRLNWRKRYITLAAVSTLLGLAFDLKDPENLLGKDKEPGITCALVPTDKKGVVLGRRHDPLKSFFINSPTEGKDVVISVDQIIGGAEQAGNGWRMLMETLAGGRGIFLPALNTGGGKFASRVISDYAVVRQQFGFPIGRFEAIEELIAPVGAKTYALDAISAFTCAALDEGNKPPVVSAIVKYNCSEFNRQIVNDSMDLLGGAGIILGPKNLMGHAHMSVPIGITVEGSNVVTRSLITFGQGLISAHPYALKELEALEAMNTKAFDNTFWKHMGMIVRNGFRATLLNLTRGFIGGQYNKPMSRYYRKLNWASANFAFMSDLALGTLGGALKKKEKLSGRYADILSWLYISVCVLRKYEEDGQKEKDRPFVEWMLEHALSNIQLSFENIYRNLPTPVIGGLFKYPIYWWARINPLSSAPSDKLGSTIAQAMQYDEETRDRLTKGIYTPKAEDQQLNILEEAHRLCVKNADLYAKIREGMKSGELKDDWPEKLIENAFESGILTKEECDELAKTERIRGKAVEVDSFTLEELPVNLKAPQQAPADADID